MIVYKQPQAARGASNFLLDGPMMLATERRAEMLGRMADALVEHDAFGSEQDAIRMLHHLGFGWMNVSLLAGEALVLARRFVETQGMVAAQILDRPT